MIGLNVSSSHSACHQLLDVLISCCCTFCTVQYHVFLNFGQYIWISFNGLRKDTCSSYLGAPLFSYRNHRRLIIANTNSSIAHHMVIFVISVYFSI